MCDWIKPFIYRDGEPPNRTVDLRELQTEKSFANPWISVYYWSGGIHFIVYILIGGKSDFPSLISLHYWLLKHSSHLHWRTFAYTNISFHSDDKRTFIYTQTEKILTDIAWLFKELNCSNWTIVVMYFWMMYFSLFWLFYLGKSFLWVKYKRLNRRTLKLKYKKSSY